MISIKNLLSTNTNLAGVIVRKTMAGENSVVVSADAALYSEGNINFDCEVTRESANTFMTVLQFLYSQGHKKVTVNIDSPGGDVISGLPMLDLMLILQKDGMIIETVGRGMSASMGSLLLMCGSKGYRKIYESGRVMIHDISTGFKGKYSEMEREFKLTTELRNRLIQIISCRTGKTIEDIDHDFRYNGDKWLSSQEAVEYGIVDDIIKVDYSI